MGKISPFPAKGFAHHLQPYEFPFKVIDRNQFGNRIYASVNKTQLIFRKKTPKYLIKLFSQQFYCWATVNTLPGWAEGNF